MIEVESTISAEPHRAASHLADHARRVQFRASDLSWDLPAQKQTWLLCPTLTPLYYTPSWSRLTLVQQLRYNQLAGLASNELIGLFENTFRPVFATLSRCPRLPTELRDLLPGFIEDETRHIEIWWRLNQLVEPAWYARRPLKLIQLPWMARSILWLLRQRPEVFPAIVWMILILEEHSLEITRRCLRCTLPIEPRFLEAYRLHAMDEARHVRIDWLILERLMDGAGPALRNVNAKLLCQGIRRFLLRPLHAATRVVRALVREFPALAGQFGTMWEELACLERNPSYREMIFSRRSNAVTFEMAARYPQVYRNFADFG